MRRRRKIWQGKNTRALALPPARFVHLLGSFLKSFLRRAKTCARSAFVSDAGRACQREDVREVAPIIQSHNGRQISSLGQKGKVKVEWVGPRSKSASTAPARRFRDQETGWEATPPHCSEEICSEELQ